jgi:class 3 adenylate cyclase
MSEDDKKNLSSVNNLIAGISQPAHRRIFGTSLDPISGFSFEADMRPLVASFDQNRVLELNEEISTLKRRLNEQAQEAIKAKTGEKEQQEARKKIEETLKRLQKKESLNYLLTRVNEQAQSYLLSSETFQNLFAPGKECNSFVMSVDIRRSTELMLKVRKAEGFAEFITDLCHELGNIVKTHYGVFDKFTGDGILAFFPDFYSGDDAGLLAVAAAEKCHRTFEAKYREHRKSFMSVLKGVGLGIGIDYGPTHLVRILGDLTVVGPPVVYACRMGGAEPGNTLLNQPAYEIISERFGQYCFIRETEIEIKHEGRLQAYEVKRNGQEIEFEQPRWELEKDLTLE